MKNLMLFVSLLSVGCSVAHAQTGQAIVVDFPAVTNVEGKACGPGRACVFTVRLAEQPAGNVAVPIARDIVGKTATGPNPIGFTPSNWDHPQSVLTLGISDPDALDEFVTYTLTATDGTNQLAPPVNVYVIIIDDEHP